MRRVIMDKDFFIELLINVIQNIIISGIVVFYLKKIIDKKFSKQEKQDNYFYLVLNDLRKNISKVKASGIKIICLEGDTVSNLNSFFKDGGDFQIFVEENSKYFKYINKQRKKDVMHIKELNHLIELIKEVGVNMIGNETDCIIKINEVITLCTELLNEYNVLVIK